MTVSYVVQLVGWYAIGVALIALFVTVAGRYIDRHPNRVEGIAEDRLAHEEVVDEIRASPLSSGQLARSLNVHPSTVARARLGESWA